MKRYAVTLTATASRTVTVKAETEAEAEERAWSGIDLPYFPAGMRGDLSDWETRNVEEVGE